MDSNNNIKMEKIGRGAKKIAIVTLVHGDETETLEIAEGVKDNLQDSDLEKLTFYFIFANHQAYDEEKRFIDADLNRVFPGKINGNKEEKLAFDLTKILQEMDLVIDLHSTPAITEPFFIMTKKDENILKKLQGKQITKLCMMSQEVASGKALIDYCKGFSLEVNEKEEMKGMIDVVLAIIREEKSEKSLEIFEVYKIINEKIDHINNFKKFVLAGEIFYPILFGETDYEFTCLAARKVS